MFQIEGRDPVEHVGAGGIAEGRASQITEIDAQDEQALEALGVSRFLAEDAIGIGAIAFVYRSQDELLVVVLGMGCAAQPGGVSAGFHGYFFGKGGHGLVGYGAQCVLRGRGHSSDLVGIKDADGVGVQREEVAQSDAVQRDVGQRRAEQGVSVGVGPPSAVADRDGSIDRLKGAGVVCRGNAS